MKTRDIRVHLTKQDGVRTVIEHINEELIQTRRDLNELAAHFDKLASLLTNVVDVQAHFKDRILRNEQKDDDMNVSTNSLAVDGKLKN